MAHRLTVHPDARGFERGGVRTFLLGDTVWAAFVRAERGEWREYVRRRAAQGFNAVYVSVLPIVHDRSVGRGDRSPFAARPDGSRDFGRLDEDYFARAAAMAEEARAAGLTPHLVLLWCTYVPDNWASERHPGHVLTQEQTDAYVRRCLEVFTACDPVWVVSGDDAFTGGEARARYRRALRQVRAHDPHALTVLHPGGGVVVPPESADDPDLDFHAYQGGHAHNCQSWAWQLAERYVRERAARPVVHMEPCYEHHGRVGGEGRFSAREVRAASWSGVLAGATAGLGYGAHGVWSWHRTGDGFLAAPFSGTPLDVADALALPGADDVALLRRIVEEHGLFTLRSRQDLLVDGPPGTRVAASGDGRTLAVYAAGSGQVTLARDLSGHTARTWALADRAGHRTDVVADGPHTHLPAPPGDTDAVHVFTS